jgi:hypothetical protein
MADTMTWPPRRLYKLIDRQLVPCDDVREWENWYLESTWWLIKMVGPIRIYSHFHGFDLEEAHQPPLLFRTDVDLHNPWGESQMLQQRFAATQDEADRQHALAVRWAKRNREKLEATFVLTPSPWKTGDVNVGRPQQERA